MTTSIDPHPAHSPSAPRKAKKLPGRLARFVPPVAGTRMFPLWAVLGHVGRTSGSAYSTAVVARRTPDGFVIPLPFGEETQWAKNLFAAGGGMLRVAGRDWTISDPEMTDLDGARAALGPVFSRASKALGIHQFVRVRRA